jgi:hypothetical protein
MSSPVSPSSLVYPYDLESSEYHQTYFLMQPYISIIDPGSKGDNVPVINTRDLPPIKMFLPHNFMEVYSHDYQSEEILMNSQGVSGTIVKDMLVGIAKENGFGFAVNNTSANMISSNLRGGSRSNMELLYNRPNQREFSFSFKFLPQNSTDENNLKNIILYLKWLSAPEVKGVYQKYPHVFDLTFLSRTPNHAVSSKNLSSVFTFTIVALTQITFNPDPSGGKMSLSKSGFPIESTLELQFKEVRYLSKDGIIGEING